MEAILFTLNVALIIYLCRLVMKIDQFKDKKPDLHIFSYKDQEEMK